MKAVDSMLGGCIGLFANDGFDRYTESSTDDLEGVRGRAFRVLMSPGKSIPRVDVSGHELSMCSRLGRTGKARVTSHGVLTIFLHRRSDRSFFLFFLFLFFFFLRNWLGD